MSRTVAALAPEVPLLSHQLVQDMKLYRVSQLTDFEVPHESPLKEECGSVDLHPIEIIKNVEAHKSKLLCIASIPTLKVQLANLVVDQIMEGFAKEIDEEFGI
mmetsp:Transcript_39084/g.59579  ORF Transcript_39084/g.59579 Transcript_39084/m.59579 type:complete len:103 (+) Transcript_39084:39-347(+)